jgi:hypothetical protein
MNRGLGVSIAERIDYDTWGKATPHDDRRIPVVATAPRLRPYCVFPAGRVPLRRGKAETARNAQLRLQVLRACLRRVAGLRAAQNVSTALVSADPRPTHARRLGRQCPPAASVRHYPAPSGTWAWSK